MSLTLATIPGNSFPSTFGTLILTSYVCVKASACIPFSILPPLTCFCAASTLMVVGVDAVMPLISASGIETFTFTLLISRMVTIACEGNAVSPAPTSFLPMTPLTGAFSWQSARFFFAISYCDCACATLL